MDRVKGRKEEWIRMSSREESLLDLLYGLPMFKMELGDR